MTSALGIGAPKPIQGDVMELEGTHEVAFRTSSTIKDLAGRRPGRIATRLHVTGIVQPSLAGPSLPSYRPAVRDDGHPMDRTIITSV